LHDTKLIAARHCIDMNAGSGMLGTMSETIAIIGTGNVGGALAVRLGRAGYAVRLGAREGKNLRELVERAGASARVDTPAQAAAAADVVMLAVPGKAVVEAAMALGDLTGKVVVDCTNPVGWDAGPVWAPPAEGSNAAALAAALPGVRVVKAFNTFGAEFHADPTLPGGPADVQIAGDDAAARGTVAAIAERAGFTPVDVGPLRNAALLESLAILWIHLATVGGRGRDAAFKLVARK
jgi:8-hydroxy-5-deazaflavin:NADPH oxidoreductase